jgi:hypothetical protein
MMHGFCKESCCLSWNLVPCKPSLFALVLSDVISAYASMKHPARIFVVDVFVMKLQAAVTDREDRLTMEDGVPRRDFWGVSSAVNTPPASHDMTASKAFLSAVCVCVHCVKSLKKYSNHDCPHVSSSQKLWTRCV